MAAETESDSAKSSREQAELRDAQADMAKAYGDYYSALRKSPSTADLDALQAQTMGAAQGRMVALLSKRHDEGQKMLFNKAYFSDGTVMDADKWAKDPNSKKFAEEDTLDFTGDKDKKKGGKVVQNGNGVPGAGASTFTSGSGDRETGKRPEFTLDGTNVPKELSFPGKRKPASK